MDYLLAPPLLILPPLITAGVMFYLYHRAGPRLPDLPVQPTEYEPLAGLNPALSSLILGSAVDTTAITALILQLCAAGYLQLNRDSQGSYLIELITTNSSLDPEQLLVINIFFPEPTAHQLAPIIHPDLNSAKHRGSTITQIFQSASQRVADLGYFKVNPATAMKSAKWGLYYLLFIGIWIISVIADKDARKITYLLASLPDPVPFILLWLILGLFLAALVNITIASSLPRLTIKGVQAKDYLQGYKGFVEQVVWPQVQALQQPDNIATIVNPTYPHLQTLQFSEKFLSYTLVYHLDHNWQNVFLPLYQEYKKSSKT